MIKELLVGLMVTGTLASQTSSAFQSRSTLADSQMMFNHTEPVTEKYVTCDSPEDPSQATVVLTVVRQGLMVYTNKAFTLLTWEQLAKLKESAKDLAEVE